MATGLVNKHVAGLASFAVVFEILVDVGFKGIESGLEVIDVSRRRVGWDIRCSRDLSVRERRSRVNVHGLEWRGWLIRLRGVERDGVGVMAGRLRGGEWLGDGLGSCPTGVREL